MKLRRFTKTQIKNRADGAPVLSKGAARLNFVAMAERTINGKRSWVLELPTEVVERLLGTKEHAKRLRKKSGALTEVNRVLEAQCRQQAEDLEKLRKVNAQLMKNIEEDRRPEKFVGSPKNFLQVMEEKNLPLRGLAAQGGLPGAGKK